MPTPAPIQLVDRQRDMLRTVLTSGGRSRSQLYHHLGLRKNTVTSDVSMLLESRLLHERPERAELATGGGGRPRVPLEVDPQYWQLIGLAIQPGRVLCGRVDLRGDPVDAPVAASVTSPKRLLGQAGRLLRRMLNDHTLAVGLSVPGFLDLNDQRVVFSAAWPDASPISLKRLIDLAAPRPVVAHNNVHALAARWLLQVDQSQTDHLLVSIGDGELGAALIVGGRPTSGCLAGANELGHMRLEVPTPSCYCGEVGCLERICSSEYLRQLDPQSPPLNQLVNGEMPATPALDDLLNRLSRGLANAINFSRVGNVSLAGRFGSSARPFFEELVKRTREQVLRELRARCVIRHWDQSVRSSTVAASLAMARIYLPGW